MHGGQCMEQFKTFQFNFLVITHFSLCLILFFTSPVLSLEQTTEVSVPDKQSENNQPVESNYKAIPNDACIIDWNFKPGDGIKISVIPDSGFPNGIFAVDGQGYVDLPMIGPIQVTSMDRNKFQEIVTDTYIPLLRFSSIQVRRVISLSFQGGFQRPGVYWISPGATLWYALSLTGGVVREDGLRKIKWERNGEVMEIKGADLLKNPIPVMELGFQSGDVIRVINRPNRTGWEVFRQEILPIVSLGVSSAVSAITVYEWMQRR